MKVYTTNRISNLDIILGLVGQFEGQLIDFENFKTTACRGASFVWLVGFLMSLATTRLYREQVPNLTSDHFTCCHTRDRAARP